MADSFIAESSLDLFLECPPYRAYRFHEIAGVLHRRGLDLHFFSSNEKKK
jgi:hypothetical protein